MINETSDSPFPASGTTLGASGTTGTTGSAGSAGLGTSASGIGSTVGSATHADAAVHRMARAAHDAVDRLEQALGTGSERVMDWQREYGDMARDQVRSNPLAAVGVAFGVGVLFSKLFMR